VRLYLASTSPARLATLRAAGIEPILLSSGVDEEAAVAAAGPLTAAEMVLLLARLKAEAVVDQLVDGEPIDGVILGGDSAFELDGVVYGKPHEPAIARERWMLQRGREGLLHSGHWLIDHRAATLAELSAADAPGVGAVSTASVRFADDISDAEIDAYVATGEPLEVAGAFTIDSLGGAFITEVRGDPHAVVGLSLATVRELLLQFDIAWTSLWNRGL
jgi:septum formation protein